MSASGRTTRTPVRRGFVMITMIVCLTIMVAFLGLAIDVGYQEYMKVRMQTAADAAALGGAREMRASGAGNLITAAKGDASTNGFTDGQNSVSITVNNPPASGYSTGDSSAVEVLISQSVPTFFMRILGFSTGTVKARAVARTAGGTTCFFALDPSMSAAFTVSNGVDVSSACGIMVNSSSATALTSTGGAVLRSSGVIAVTGKYKISNGATISPLPIQGVAAANNPLASLPIPPVGNCDHTNYSVASNTHVTISQGVYCNGISVSNGGVVNLNPGVYIVKGGGINLSGAAVFTGTGVTFYLTAGGTYTYAGLNFSNGATETLTAPTSGNYAGILFFQDPNIVGGGASIFQGGTNANLAGTLYFPTTALQFSNGANAAYTIIVVKSITFTGGVTLNNNYSSLPGGSPIKGATALSE